MRHDRRQRSRFRFCKIRTPLFFTIICAITRKSESSCSAAFSGCGTPYVYANFGLTCVEDPHIHIGEHTMIGPNCVFATANHPVLPELREKASTRCHKPRVPLRTKHSDTKRTLPPLGERLQRLFGIRGRMICQTKRFSANWMLLACIFLIFKNAPAVHQV